MGDEAKDPRTRKGKRPAPAKAKAKAPTVRRRTAARKSGSTRRTEAEASEPQTAPIGKAAAAGASAPRRARSPLAGTPTGGTAEERTPLPAARRGAARSDADRSGKYVYCIIQSTTATSFGTIGIGAEPMEVYTIGYKDIAAVVSDTPLEVYDPTRENVLSHEGVNERVMHDHTVIPMSFGTVFKTADDIVELLRSAYSAFRDVLQKMENKLEFGLKVLWDPDEILQVVEKEDESLRRLREEILKQRGSTYFARMQYGRMVDSLLQEQSVYYQREIFDGLRGVSVASRSNKVIGERMIMNAAFLVSRDKEPEFDAAVKRIGSRYPQLTFKYTGPWPPYNFVNIRLKLERAEDAG